MAESNNNSNRRRYIPPHLRETNQRHLSKVGRSYGDVAVYPHTTLPKHKLSQIKLKNRNICRVEGLPMNENEQRLRGKYGKFGKIQRIFISSNAMLRKHESVMADIIFDDEKSVKNAIKFSNNYIFKDNRKLRARFGDQSYCLNFIGNKQCNNKCSKGKHEWAESNDVFTRNDMNSFRAKKFGLTIKDKMKTLENKNAALLKENKLLIQSLNALKSEKTKMTENIKQKEAEIHSLKQTVKDLEPKLISQKSENWSGEDIVIWIVNLNKSLYSKYYDDLIENIRNEGINGENLADFDKNDLHRLGITQFKDKKDIYEQIQQLIESE